MSGFFPWMAIGFAGGYTIGLLFAKRYWTLAKRERAAAAEYRDVAEKRGAVAAEAERRIAEMVAEGERRMEEHARLYGAREDVRGVDG